MLSVCALLVCTGLVCANCGNLPRKRVFAVFSPWRKSQQFLDRLSCHFETAGLLAPVNFARILHYLSLFLHHLYKTANVDLALLHSSSIQQNHDRVSMLSVRLQQSHTGMPIPPFTLGDSLLLLLLCFSFFLKGVLSCISYLLPWHMKLQAKRCLKYTFVF